MCIYRIADLNIKINPVFGENKSRLEPYITCRENFDFDASVTTQEIAGVHAGGFSEAAIESSLIFTKVCRTALEKYDGFFFHSSALMLDGEAYVFTAQSGTGKSTHAALWRKHFSERVTMINDDKPIIRRTDGKFYIYGTPWMGKSDIGANIKCPVRAVYVLKRGNGNEVRRVSVGEVFKELFEATLIPNDIKNTNILLSLFDEFFSSVQLFSLSCNMSEDAVTAAYNAANGIV